MSTDRKPKERNSFPEGIGRFEELLDYLEKGKTFTKELMKESELLCLGAIGMTGDKHLLNELIQIIVLTIAGVDRVIGLAYGDIGPFEEPIRNRELVEITDRIAKVIFKNAYYLIRLQKKPQ